jgi:adenosine/AMP kinase
MVKIVTVKLKMPKGVNLVLGQSHFIKTVEDLYEVIATAHTSIKFGVAFCESSGPALIRYDGNDEELIEASVRVAKRIAAGHTFTILLKEGFPINILDRIKNVQEVVTLFCATANPVDVIVADTGGGRAVLGVADGVRPAGVESKEDQEARINLLRSIGYKR